MQHVLILGAGFGGLELATRLSSSLSDEVHVTLLDQSDSFIFGFSKLDILIGRQTRDAVSCRYRDIAKPGVEFRQERVIVVDPHRRHVVTDSATYDPDILVVALGAYCDPAATAGFVADGYEYYSAAGAERLRDALAAFTGGRLILAVLGVPYKCPPAPYEGALLIHEYLVSRGVRDATDLQVISPSDVPIPISAEASTAIKQALAERSIGYTPGARVTALDPIGHVAHLATGDRPYDLFIGIPVHRVPEVIAESGLTLGGNDGWVAVNPRTLATRFPGVYALGDCADAPVPRAGVFAETAARAVADNIAATIHGSGPAAPYDGKGSCYIEFGGGLVGKVDADILSGPYPRAPLLGPSRELVQEKEQFTAARRRRWFGS